MSTNLTARVTSLPSVPEQEALIRFNDGEGPLLVLAAAGSGKTHVLTERVRYLLTEKGGRFSVLCLTFTNKAAEEMQKRLETSVPDIRRRAFIGTLHGFALEVFTSRRHHLGFSEMLHIIDRDNDRKKIIEEVLLSDPGTFAAFHLKEPKEQDKELGHWLQWMRAQKQNLVFAEGENDPLPPDWTSEEQAMFRSYNRLLRGQNLLDFEDILIFAYRILAEFQAIARLYRQLYPYILVDEAQDLNFAQYHLLKAFCGDTHRNVLMVGDPDQAIHHYAGADKKFMLENFPSDFGAARKEMRKNYRCSQAVIQFANSIIPDSGNPDDSYFKGLVKIQNFVDEQAEADWVLGTIRSLIAQTNPDFQEIARKELPLPLSLDRVAILARNRFVFRELLLQLDKDPLFRDNYFVKKSSEGLEMDSEMMRVFDLGTRLLCNPKDEIHLRQITQALKIIEPPTTLHKDGIANLQSLRSLIPANGTEGFGNDYETLLRAWAMLVSIKEVRMQDALDLLKQAASEKPDEERERVLGDIQVYEKTWSQFLSGASSNINLLAAFRQFGAMGSSTTSKQKGLTLATVHTAKGLEFDIVFLVGMTDGTFPDFRAKNPTQINEERNVAYVAVTRTKRWLFVTYPEKKWMPWQDWKRQQPSRFIQPILEARPATS
jgi:DNA helicase II / ATP-dependent DNA helicase PcrA